MSFVNIHRTVELFFFFLREERDLGSSCLKCSSCGLFVCLFVCLFNSTSFFHPHFWSIYIIQSHIPSCTHAFSLYIIQSQKKVKTSESVMSLLLWIRMEFAMLVRALGLMKFMNRYSFKFIQSVSNGGNIA